LGNSEHLRRNIFIALSLSFFLASFVLSTHFVFAYSYIDYVSTISHGADRLAALQSDVTEDNAGNGLADLDPEDAGWDWDVISQSFWVGNDCMTTIGANQSCQNLYGVTAMGLLDAYMHTGVGKYQIVATDVANFMINPSWGTASSGAFWNDRNIGSRLYYFGFSFDYRFLMRYADVTNNAAYSIYATDAWSWQKSNIARYADGNQIEIFQRTYAHVGGSYGYAAWQSSDYGLAALEMGDTSWASNMAIVVNNNMTNILSNADEYRVIGWAKALELLSRVDGSTYSSSISSLKSALQSSQLPSGCWDAGNSEGSAQDTAYAVLGLVAANDEVAARKGADCLVAAQQANGGWMSSDEFSETNSEAIQAISAVMGLDVTRRPKVTSLVMSDIEPVKAGVLSVIVGFDKSMNTVIIPTVTLNGPKTLAVNYDPAYTNGWINATAWAGKVTIAAPSVSDGYYRFFVKNAKDIFGTTMVTYIGTRFYVDSNSPAFFATFVPDIYSGQIQTVSASVYDPSSSGISHVSVKIDSDSEINMTFSHKTKEKIDKKTTDVETYFKMFSSLPLGTHSVTFKVYDNVGNFAQLVDSFDVLPAATSNSGDVAYLCLTNACDYGVEQSVIDFLEANGWTVTAKAYNQWTALELSGYDLIVCSEQGKVCKPTPALIEAHTTAKVPLVELSSSPSAKAGKEFDYLKGSSASMGRATTQIFVTNPDAITAGYFGLTIILNSEQRIPGIGESNLLSGTAKLASRYDRVDMPNLFKVDGTSSHGRYVGVLWFNSKTSYGVLSGYDLNSLNSIGKEILKRSVSWAQCANPTGCAA